MSRTWSRPKIALAGLLLALFTSAAHGDFPAAKEAKTTTPYPPVEITFMTFTAPRALRVWSVKIDLNSPDIDFMVTPRGKFDNPKLETAAVTTLDFARAFRTQVSINATCSEPAPRKGGAGVDIQGLSISLGDIYSLDQGKAGGVVIDTKHRVSILASPIKTDQLKDVHHGVGGHFLNGVILAEGKNLVADNKQTGSAAALHPRTAVGLSADKKTMWWLIVDGRQKQISEGVYLVELAELGKKLGCNELINLDGGGSTTLVLQEPKAADWKVINTPVGLGKPGSLRSNGNSIGLYVFTPDRAITSAQLKAIMPTLTTERLATFLGPLNRTMWKNDITTPKRRAAFLAQLAHESGELKYMEEIASGKAHEGRKDLGNTEPGDGTRYKGRGPIQLTGRANYRAAGAALGLELEKTPELVARPEIGCLVAGWFWSTQKLNDLAEAGDFKQITRRINGGLNGLKQREAYHRKALEVFK